MGRLVSQAEEQCGLWFIKSNMDDDSKAAAQVVLDL